MPSEVEAAGVAVLASLERAPRLRSGMRIRFNTGRPKRSEPSREFAPHQRLDHRHARRVGVEAGQIGEIPAPRFDELPLAANRELFEDRKSPRLNSSH